MKKQLLLFLLMMLPMVVMANKSGSCGNGVTFQLDEATGVLTISKTGDGNGEMTGSWEENSIIRTVIIEDGVTSICGWAFAGCTSLNSIQIPNSVTSIGNSTFYNCISLTSIRIPNGVISIGDGAFEKCTSLTSVVTPNSVTSIGQSAFRNCNGLTSINIGNSVTSISGNAFKGCSGLTFIKVEKDNPKYDSRNDCNAIIETTSNTLVLGCKNSTIPNSVTMIGSNAFEGCSGLTSVTIPNSVTRIGNSAFYGCSGLTSVTIPNSVKRIDGNAFQNCIGLTSVIIPNSVTIIGSSAFMGCSGLTSVTIPNSVTRIYGGVFSGCTGLTSVIIPNSVTDIGSSAFSGCTGLTSVTIPNSVTSIGNYAFSGCTRLREVSLSDGLETIGTAAFQGCTSLISLFIPKSVTSIQSETTTPVDNRYYYESLSIISGCKNLRSITVDKDNTTYDSRNDCNAIIETATNKLIVGCGKSTIPEGIESITCEAFQGCEELESIYIPSSFRVDYGYFGQFFSGCINLKSITVDKDNLQLDSRDNCNAIILTELDRLVLGCQETVIPNSVKAIGNFSFYHYNVFSPMTSLVINNSIEEIENYAFPGCMLENIILKNPQTRINSTSFSDATYQHAILYVPAGQRWDAIYSNGGWYRFNNIREIAMESRELSEARAYTLMNTNDFSLAVYDAVNGKVVNAKSLYDIDENNAKNSWQIVKNGDKKYLFNIGAGKYATISADGKLSLADTPVAITMTENEKGIILGDNRSQQWGFVVNENVKPYENLTAIEGITTDTTPNVYYSLDGQRLNQTKKGLNIIRTSDGKMRKLLVK